jgi:hypothetical protein
MPNLLNTPIAAAGTFTGPIYQIRQGPMQAGAPMSLCAEKLFTWAAGGTSVDTYLQTSLDGGNTWDDVVHWAQNLAASDAGGRPLYASVNSLTVLPTTGAPVATTDGAQTVNTTNLGLFGQWWRVKYVVVGTYTGLTTLRVDVACSDMVPAGVGSFN